MNNSENIDDLIKKLEEDVKSEEERERVLDLRRMYHGPDELVDAESFKKDKEDSKEDYKILSGLKELDTIIEGFRPGNLVVISGPTKQGKTTLCQTLTLNFSNAGSKCLWFSFDTPALELVNRFTDLPTFYLPKRNAPEKKLEWIESKIIEGVAKYNIQVVFIDHLEFLSKFSSNMGNYATELQSIVRELKEMAIRWNVVIFLNHHIRGIGYDETPNWTHLKNSSGVAQDSDITLMVWREKIKGTYGPEYTNTSIVSVQLHRRTGKTGTVKLQFDGNRFADFEEETVEKDF
jgi:replicative DNA helicase